MDDVKDFFDFSKPFAKKAVQGGFVSGKILTSVHMKDNEIIKREKIATEYVEDIVKEEQSKMDQLMDEYEAGSSSLLFNKQISKMSSIDRSSSDDSDDEMDSIAEPRRIRDDREFYKQYNFNNRSEVRLPIHENEKVILETVEINPVCVLTGDTGCGKTTQVPQFILDNAQRKGEYCNIVCTQPRRIAAISIAQRVCAERKWELGGLVGFQVGLHTLSNDNTRLLYCTTGVLLQKLVLTKSMNKYTHIILDEVHERDQEMDFLLIVIRRLLISNSPNTKVVLMSATINPREFSNYFSSNKCAAPVLKVDNRRRFQVNDFYFCELDALTKNFEGGFDMTEPKLDEGLYLIALKLLYICESLDRQENSIEINGFRSTVLIFLPGVNEIDNMEKCIEENKGDNMFNTIRLHSLISAEEQQKAFIKANKDVRKIILATNIAESSITVPDVKYVIDFCLTKNLMTDSSTNFSSLQLHWASKANCLQRSGRAGRVMNGRVYRLVPKEFYDKLPDYGIPEMLRIPLENVVLKAKQLDMGPPHSILGLALTPPNLSDIYNTILILKELGGLIKTVNGVYMEFDGDLSLIGKVMSALPLDIRISRLVIFGYMFSVFEECLIIAAGLSVKSIFTNPYQEAFPAWLQRLTYADGSESDLFAIWKAYTLWKRTKEQGLLHRTQDEAAWARKYYLNTKSLKEMSYLIEEIKKRLMHFNIREFEGTDRTFLLEREKSIILKICIAGAFYPNYFVRSSYGNGSHQKEAFHTLCGNNPCNTVYFKRFDQKCIGELYIQKIKELFEVARIPPENIHVKFENGNEKVFVTFKDDPTLDGKYSNRVVVPGKVKLEVYKAIKMRQAKCSTSIYVMDPHTALSCAVKAGIGELKFGRFEKNKPNIKHKELMVIPSVFTKSVRGNITHIDHCSKFFFMPLSEREIMESIKSSLNDFDLEHFDNISEVTKGMIVAAKYNGKYMRAKILSVMLEVPCRGYFFTVQFIDSGNIELIKYNIIRKIVREDIRNIPPRVFECTLAGIRPSLVKCSKDIWIREAIEMFSELQALDFIEIEVYSVVEGISSVKISINNRLTINEELVLRGYAQNTDESYLSKVDHDLRIRRQGESCRSSEDTILQNEEYFQNLLVSLEEVIVIPNNMKCMVKMNLNGPHSPLETRMYSAMRIGSLKSVDIEQNSVNSVMLDSDPQDNHERLLVAVNVTEQVSSQKLIARSVSLMPNIHGFGALMAMIFAPQMQLKRNKDMSRYTAVLCGLGFDSITKHSIFEEHDILLHLDVELTTQDIELINKIRYLFDTLLYTEVGEDKPNFSQKNASSVCENLKQTIIQLLEKNRKFMEIVRSQDDNVWDLYDKRQLLESNMDLYKERAIFPPHNVLPLQDPDIADTEFLVLHCDALHDCRRLDHLDSRITKCFLCDEPLESIVELRIHILSQLHRDRESQIQYIPKHLRVN